MIKPTVFLMDKVGVMIGKVFNNNIHDQDTQIGFDLCDILNVGTAYLFQHAFHRFLFALREQYDRWFWGMKDIVRRKARAKIRKKFISNPMRKSKIDMASLFSISAAVDFTGTH